MCLMAHFDMLKIPYLRSPFLTTDHAVTIHIKILEYTLEWVLLASGLRL